MKNESESKKREMKVKVKKMRNESESIKKKIKVENWKEITGKKFEKNLEKKMNTNTKMKVRKFEVKEMNFNV